jgi:hypothetical protein
VFTPSDDVDIDVKTGFSDSHSVQSGSRSSSVIGVGQIEGVRSPTPIRHESTTTPRTPSVRISRNQRSSERPSSIRHQDSMFSQASSVMQVTSGDVKVRELSRRRRQATALRSITKDLGTKGGSSGDGEETYTMGGDFDNEGEVCSMVDGSVVVFRTDDAGDNKSAYLGRSTDTVKREAAAEKEIEKMVSSTDSAAPAVEAGDAPASTPAPAPASSLNIVDPIFSFFDFSSYYS